MENDKINSLGLCSLIPFLSSSAFLGSGYLYLFNITKKSSLLSLVLGLILSIFICFLIYKSYNKNPSLTFNKKMEKTFGTFFSKIVLVVLTIVLILMGSIVMYRLVSFFNTQFLTDTPQIYLSILLGILIYVISSKNIEVLSRFAIITLVFSILIFIFNASTLIPYVEKTNVLPVINSSWKDIIKSAIVSCLLFTGPLFLLFIIPKDNVVDNKNIFKYYLFFLIINALMLIIICFMTLSTLGIDVINLYTYPVYVVLKKVHVFDFINSIENIIILLWFFYLIVTSSISFMFAKNIINELFKVKKIKTQKIILFIFMITGIVLVHYLFTNNISLDDPKIVYFPSIIYAIFIIICITHLIVSSPKSTSKLS